MSKQESIGYWDENDKPKSTGYRDPFYNLPPAIAGASTTNAQPSLASHIGTNGTASLLSQLNEHSLQDIQRIVRDAIHHELNPELLSGEPLQPLINRSHIGVEVSFVDFDGQEYHGVLYPTKVDK